MHPNRTRETAVPGGATQDGIQEEPLYTSQQVADYLQFDVTTVRRLFIDRADVVKTGHPKARGGRRSYVTLRIPLSALRAFIAERKR
jgi:hypothetical protein